MTSVPFVIVFAILVSGLGRPIVDRLDSHNHLSEGERIGVSFFLGCFVVYFAVFFIGAWRLDLLTMGGFAGVVLLLSLPGLKSMPWKQYGAAIKAQKLAMASDPWLAVLWLAAILIGLSSILQGMAPPNDYDSLMYHLSLPRFDVELGKLGTPWDRGLPHMFFPSFATNLSRLALVLADDGEAQMIHGLFGLLAALGSASLLYRLGYSHRTGLLAAIFFLAIRAVIWEMATVETDVVVGAAMILAICIYLSWREHPETGLAVLFGIVIGGAILIKLHGFALAASLAPLIIFDMVRNPRIGWRALIGPIIALLVIVPHLIKTYWLTANPLFPLFNNFFNPEMPLPFNTVGDLFGTGRGLVDFLSAPWNFSILPMHYFDGMVLGAPYLLALCPLLLLDKNRRRWFAILSITVAYYVIWFYVLSQQVRFLLPIAPILTGAAAVGVTALWKRLDGHSMLRKIFAAIMGVLAINQLMFIAVYGAIRLPVAFGLISDAAFHEKTPTMGGAHYKTCTYIAKNLKHGERYYSSAPGFLSYYCPQVSVVRNYFPEDAKWWLETDNPPKLSPEEFLRRLKKYQFRYFITTTGTEFRRNKTAKKVFVKSDNQSTPYGIFLKPVFTHLKPLIEGPYTAVFDGPSVLELMQKSNPPETGG
ncbi:MAG: phospholipid carrier-dependent glycosyltransferase [Rhodospirillales bacterium]|nr:phospholipid carrier-dependent glycosyltransferase [Rhodospirillales bacterium]